MECRQHLPWNCFHEPSVTQNTFKSKGSALRTPIKRNSDNVSAVSNLLPHLAMRRPPELRTRVMSLFGVTHCNNS